jgi:hypothetical protein
MVSPWLVITASSLYLGSRYCACFTTHPSGDDSPCGLLLSISLLLEYFKSTRFNASLKILLFSEQKQRSQRTDRKPGLEQSNRLKFFHYLHFSNTDANSGRWIEEPILILILIRAFWWSLGSSFQPDHLSSHHRHHPLSSCWSGCAPVLGWWSGPWCVTLFLSKVWSCYVCPIFSIFACFKDRL